MGVRSLLFPKEEGLEPKAAQALNIGGSRQLFVDGYIIDEIQDVE